MLRKAVAPLGHRRPGDPQALRDLRVGQTLAGKQHDPGPPHEPLGAGASPRPALQLIAFLVAEDDRTAAELGITEPYAVN